MEHGLQHLFSGLPAPVLLLLIALCLLILSRGADWMIEGVVDLAARTGLPRIIIGATIISLGTTLPEAFVSVMAAWMGNPGLALGNGVGSVIADTGLVLGATALFAPIPLDRFVLSRTGTVQIGAGTLLVFLAGASYLSSSGLPVLGRPAGILLLACLAGYMYLSYLWAGRGGAAGIPIRNERRAAGRCWGLVLAGLFLVIAAARVLVPCAAETAGRLGVPEDIVAATMIALGTSLPELSTAIASVRKGHPEIMVGNVVGADVLNCLFVVGASAVAAPLRVPPTFFIFHFPAMLLVLYSFRLFVALSARGRMQRWQGGWLLAVYVAYVTLQYI
jgi:cation:H+ antiporter